MFERGNDMRKENPHWEYNKEISMYDKSDYRSKFYAGKWQNAWLKEVASYAIKNNKSIYESMWLKYEDKNEHMPKRLFKFFPFNENSIKCIETNAVFMNNPRNFNDPFDGMLCAQEDEFIKRCLVKYLVETDAVHRGILTEDELNRLKASRCDDSEYCNVYRTFDSVILHLCYDADKQEMRKGEMEIQDLVYKSRCEYRNKLNQLRESVVGITSFANINEFKLKSFMELWAHYAQSHEGFCVEYDLTQSVGDVSDAMLMGGLLPCSYGSKQVVLSKQKMYKYVKDIPFTQYERMEFDKSILMSFLTKSSSWRYENEWRLILPLDVCAIYGNMIPFYPIKSIYVGCRMPNDNKEFIYRLAEQKGITVYNMSMHEYKFEMGYLPVDIERYFEDKSESRMIQLQRRGYHLWS